MTPKGSDLTSCKYLLVAYKSNICRRLVQRVVIYPKNPTRLSTERLYHNEFVSLQQQKSNSGGEFM